MTAIQGAALDWFADLRVSVTAQLQEAVSAAAKADDIDAKVQRILDGMDFEGYEAFVDIVRAELELLYRDGGDLALEQVGKAGVETMLDLVNAQAVDFARDRSAEMVGMKVVDGQLVPNPNAQWQVTEGTREMLRAIVTDAMEEGFSNDRIADALEDIYAFSDARAEMIARTETARADVQGNLAGWRASGEVVAKQWITGAECCDECQDLDGETVALEEEFPNDGGDGPPLHPQCRCDVLPVLPGEQEQDE